MAKKIKDTSRTQKKISPEDLKKGLGAEEMTKKEAKKFLKKLRYRRVRR